jgi:hypothetical protein
MRRSSSRRSFLGRLGAPLLFLIVLVVVGCAAGSAGASPGFLSGDAAEGGAPVVGAPPAPADEEPATGGDRTSTGGQGRGVFDAPRDGALVIKTGSLELEVTELSPTLLKARTAIVGLGGYVSASQQTSGDERQVASVTYRIPAERWDDALDALKKLGTKLVGEQTQAVDVTTQVVDLEARITNLRAAEAQLQGIMARAEKIPDILEIQAQLTQVRGEIEGYVAQKQNLEDQATYGTLAVTYEVPVLPVAEVQKGWDLQAQVNQALAQLVQLGQALATVGIWFAIVILPVLLVGAIGLALVVVIARRLGIDRRRVADRSEGVAPGA